MRQKTAAPFLSTLAGIPKMLGGLFSRKAIQTAMPSPAQVAAAVSRDKSRSSFKNFWDRNFSLGSLKVQHLAPFKDPLGGAAAFLDLPINKTVEYYKKMQQMAQNNSPALAEWAGEQAKFIEERIKANSKNWNTLVAPKSSGEDMLRAGGGLLKDNALSAAMTGWTVATIPTLADPMRQVGAGEIGPIEGVLRTGANIGGSLVAAPLTSTMGGFIARDLGAGAIGSGADQLLGLAPQNGINPFASLPPQMQNQIINQGAPYGY